MTYSDKVKAGVKSASAYGPWNQPGVVEAVLDAVNVKALVEALRREHYRVAYLSMDDNCPVCALIAEWEE